MMFRLQICIISIVEIVYGEQATLKLPISTDDQPPDSSKVALIGACIAGASAAYHLCDKYPYANLHITIYDSHSQVAGRFTSAKVYDGEYTSQQVETGARSFHADDECVQFMIDETGLRRKLKPHYPVKKSLGVWDGTSLILQCQGDLKARTWTGWARYAWRYGFSVNGMRKWLSYKLPQLHELLESWHYVHRNILRDMEYQNLTAELKSNAWSFLANLTSPKFSKEIVEATTRARLGQDLNTMHALAALASMNPVTTDSVKKEENRKIIRSLEMSCRMGRRAADVFDYGKLTRELVP